MSFGQFTDNTYALAMMGITILVVMLTSITYAKSQNYGEAALSLVAGLLTAFSVERTVGRFQRSLPLGRGFLNRVDVFKRQDSF